MMSIRALARELGISPTRVAQLRAKGMPAEPEAARAWRLTYVVAPTTAKSNVVAIHEAVSIGDALEDLEATLGRLRHVERSTAATLAGLLKEGKVSEAAVLRREHVATVRALFDAETKSIKIAETRGKLISVDRALSMISEALSESVIMLRQLPNLAPDEALRARLQALVNGILDAMKEGAHRGLERRAKSV
jgi:hypothetical protein